MNDKKPRSPIRVHFAAGALTAALLASPRALADQGNIVSGFIENVLITGGLAIVAIGGLVWWWIRKK